MNWAILIYILLALIIIIIILYYFWYLKKNDRKNREIPFDFILSDDITIIDVLEYVSKNYGHYTALKYNLQKITYKEYYDNVIKFSNNLSHIALPKDKIVIIINENKPEIFYAYLGSMLAGCIPIICNEKHSKFIINETKPKIIIDNMTIIYDENISYNDFINLPFDNITINKPKIDDIATIIYQDNKGIVITHKNIITQIKSCLSLIRKKSNIDIYIKEKIISYLPLNYITTQMIDIFIPISIVGTVYFSSKNQIIDTIKAVQPTIFIGSPNIWTMIYSQLKDHIKPEKFINKIFMNKYIINQSGLDNIKIAITTNNNIDDKTRQFYKDIDFPLFNSLIMGEATGLISLCLKNTQTNNCVGFPITDIKINSKTNEILLKGDMIFDKYYDDKILKSMDKKWFKTGYYGYLDRDGSLYMK